MVKDRSLLEYMAGFFDGEGCIGAYRLPTGVRLRCSIANTVKHSVEMFHQQFGGKLRQRKYDADRDWKPAWIWEIDFRHAEAFLKEIVSYLRIKKLQAQIAMELQKTLSVRSPIGTRRPSYRRATQEEQIQRARNRVARDVIIDFLHALNTRGNRDAIGELFKGVDTSCAWMSDCPSDTKFETAMKHMAALTVHRITGGGLGLQCIGGNRQLDAVRAPRVRRV